MIRGWRAAAGMGLLGAASAAAFAPLGLYPLVFATLAGLLAAWRTATPGRAAALGFAFGLGLNLAGVSWVYVSMHDFGGMPAPLAALATLGFCAYLATFPAAAGWLCARIVPAGGWGFAPGAAAAWTLTEWLRGWLLTGFPWLALGYAQAPPSPLAGYAPLVGVYGLGFASVALAGVLALAWRRRERLPAVAALVLVLAVGGLALGGVEWTRAGAPARSVSLLQGNVAQSLKWQPERLEQSLATYLDLARRHPADLVVLPETALPLTLDRLDPAYAAALVRAAGGTLLAGLVVTQPDGRYYNSVVTLDPGAAGRYDKRHLVPFGEFTPPLFAWTLRLLHIPLSDFSRGAAGQAPLAAGGERVAVNICYEDIFGEEIIAALPAASLLVNVSNTAWFGDSAAQPQHLQIAQLRALETGRWMLRATNTGMTAAVDPRGRVVAQLAPFTAGALTVRVEGREGMTPYARWGNLPVVALSTLLLAGMWVARRRAARAAA